MGTSSKIVGLLVGVVLLCRPSPVIGEEARLLICSPRPMAAAVRALAEQTGTCINYEDPPHIFLGEIEQLVLGGVIVQPRVSEIRFAYPRDEEIESVIRKLLETHDLAGNPGRFKFSKTDGAFNVYPTHARNVTGEWVPNESVLDRLISVSLHEVSYFDAFQAVCSAASKPPFADALGFGVNANSLLMQSQCTYDFQDKSVRGILSQIISDVNRVFFYDKQQQLTWQVRRGPKGEADNGNCVFTIVSVKKDQRQSTKLFIEDSRPIATSLRIVDEVCDIRSGYEDPVFECACDLIAGVVPSGDQVNVGWESSASASEILKAILSGTMRQNFSFTERNGRFHVFPTAVRDVNGELRAFDALTRSKISLSVVNAGATEVLSQISESLSAVSARRVSLTGLGITSTGASKKIDLPVGETRIAADLIDDAVKQVDEKLSWRLIHDPGTGNYRLEVE